MERTIGNLGEEIKQPSNPYGNLSERGLQRTQMNALAVMIPQFCQARERTSLWCNWFKSGLALLRARDTIERTAKDEERTAILQFFRPSADHATANNDAISKNTEMGKASSSQWSDCKVSLEREIEVTGTG